MTGSPKIIPRVTVLSIKTKSQTPEVPLKTVPPKSCTRHLWKPKKSIPIGLQNHSFGNAELDPYNTNFSSESFEESTVSWWMNLSPPGPITTTGYAGKLALETDLYKFVHMNCNVRPLFISISDINQYFMDLVPGIHSDPTPSEDRSISRSLLILIMYAYWLLNWSWYWVFA